MKCQKVVPAIALSLGVLMGLTACAGSGFHLRGQNPQLANTGLLADHKLVVTGVDTRSDFGRALQTQLKRAGADLTTATDQAATAVLQVGHVRETRSVSGYSSTRQVKEFNQLSQVSFTYRVKGTDQSVSDTVSASRIQTYDGTYVLGTSEEEKTIRAELRSELARLLALRVAALQRQGERR